MIKRAVILTMERAGHHSLLTYNRVHAMLPAAGKPLVARVMDRLHRIGIKEFTVIVGANEGAVAEYLDTHWQADAEVEFVLQPDNSSLAHVLASFSQSYDKPFMICSYNSFTHTQFPASLLKQHRDYLNELVLGGATSSLSKSRHHYFAVMDGQRVRSISPTTPTDPNHFILPGFMVCGHEFINYLKTLPKNTSRTTEMGMMDIGREYIQAGGTAVLTETAWILQIEQDRDLLTLNKHLLDAGQDAHILSELPYTVQIVPPVRIDPQVSVGQGAKIGPYVYLERGSSVGHEVTLRNAIILERAKVPSRKHLFDTIISTRGPIP